MSDETIASLARAYIHAREARDLARIRRAKSARSLFEGGCEGGHLNQYESGVCFRIFPEDEDQWCGACKAHQSQSHAEYQRAANAVGSLLRRLTYAVDQEPEGEVQGG